MFLTHFFFFFSSRRRHTRSLRDWSSDVCSSDLGMPSCVRNLTGYAHGASGFAHALLELYAVTRDDRYRYGAEQVMAYERACFDAQERNWPDFRYMELSEYVSYGRTAELRRLLRAGQALTPYKRTCMTAWCHGAPGIGLARLRAAVLLGNRRYFEGATAAAQTTLAGVR